MGLPVRTADQITKEMIDYFVGATPRATDFTPGSVLRTMFEAVGITTERLDVAVGLATDEAIRGSSYLTFGFQRLGANPATGAVTGSIQPGVSGTFTIPEGTRFSVPGVALKLYQSTQDVSIVLSGSETNPTIQIPIVATTGGVATNAAQGTITQIVTPINGLIAVTNNKALFNGHDIETDAERRQRFSQFIRTLQRATEDAIVIGALSTRILDVFGYEIDSVQKVNTIENNPNIPSEVDDPPNLDNPRPGTIWIFIHNGISTPSSELISACQQVINGFEDTSKMPSVLVPGFKAAGIEALVFGAVEVVVPINITYQLVQGFIPEVVEPQILATVNRFFSTNIDVGDSLRIEPLKQQIAATPGLLDFTLDAPVTNVTALYKQMIIPGTIQLTLNTG